MSRGRQSKFKIVEDERSDEYSSKWEQKFKWLSASGEGNEHYYCKVCKKDYYGGLRQITLHSSAKTHTKALMANANEPETAEVYFVDSRHAEPRKSLTPKKLHISEQQIPAEPDFEEEENGENASTSKKSELIHLKTYTSALDGKRIVLGMERRLEPLNKPKTSRVKRQVVAPYSRTNETQDAVKTIEQAEAGLLVEEEVVQPVHPIVTVKTEPSVSRNASNPNIPSRMTVIEQRPEPTDAFDVFGKHVANKLRSLTSEQNKFAQKLIMDVLFEGEMDTLDRNTKVLKCGLSCVCQQ